MARSGGGDAFLLLRELEEEEQALVAKKEQAKQELIKQEKARAFERKQVHWQENMGDIVSGVFAASPVSFLPFSLRRTHFLLLLCSSLCLRCSEAQAHAQGGAGRHPGPRRGRG
jgi:hypothetical protein